MKKRSQYTCLLGGDVSGIPSVTILEGIRAVEKWIDEHGVRVHHKDVLAGQCIHETNNVRWAMIFKGTPEALSTSVTLFRKGKPAVMGEER